MIAHSHHKLIVGFNMDIDDCSRVLVSENLEIVAILPCRETVDDTILDGEAAIFANAGQMYRALFKLANTHTGASWQTPEVKETAIREYIRAWQAVEECYETVAV